MKPLFFIDYDNTIFDHRTWSIPESAFRALERLHTEGFKVIVASGRSLERLQRTETFQGRFWPDCVIASNGAAVEAEGKLLWEKYFDPKLQKRIMDYVLEKGYCMTVNLNGQRCVSNIKRWQALNLDKQAGAEAEQAFFELYHKRLPSFFLADNPEAQHDLQEQFPEIKVLSMGDDKNGADVIPRENGKAEGGRRILEYYRTSWKNTVVIGDSMNDLEFIQKAALGIAMGNAMQAVRDAADYVTGDIGEDGLWNAVDYACRWAG